MPEPQVPPEFDSWDPETRKLAEELMEVGSAWNTSEAERRRIIDRRAELYVRLNDNPAVSHTAIAKLAGSTKGAVEAVLANQRRKAET